MWQILRVYGVGGKLLKAAQSFYVASRACVRVGNDVSAWFPVNVGLRQGCVMSPWLFNVYYYYYYEKRLAMQGREREIDTLSVRRPQPHTTNL